MTPTREDVCKALKALSKAFEAAEVVASTPCLWAPCWPTTAKALV